MNDSCDYVEACAAAMMRISQVIAEAGHKDEELGCPDRHLCRICG